MLRDWNLSKCNTLRPSKSISTYILHDKQNLYQLHTYICKRTRIIAYFCKLYLFFISTKYVLSRGKCDNHL